MTNKQQIAKLTPCAIVRGSKKTGKIDKVLTGTGYALLELWAIQNTPKTKESYLFTQDGLLIARFEGKQNDIPNITWYEDNESIEDYIPGIIAMLEEGATT